MKPKFIIAAMATIIGALAIWWFQFHLTAPIEHAHTDGEQPTLASLAENEEVVVSTFFSHRTARGREYRIRREGTGWMVAIFDTTPAWSREDGRTDQPILLVRQLSADEVKGLDETIAYCREVREEYSSATKHFRVQYLRNGKPIGDELYFGFGLPSQLAWYEQEGMRGNPDYASDYAALAVAYGVSEERMKRMLPFEMLEQVRTDDTAPPQDDESREAEVYSLQEWTAWIEGLRGCDEIRLTEAVRTIEYPTAWTGDGLKFNERWVLDVPRHTVRQLDADEFLSRWVFAPGTEKLGGHGCHGLFNVWLYRNGECVGRLHYAHGRFWHPLTNESQRAVIAWLDAHGFPASELIQAETHESARRVAR